MSWRKLKRIKNNDYTRYIIKVKGIDYIVALYVRLVRLFKDKPENGSR